MMNICEKTGIGARLLIITVFLSINALAVVASLQMIINTKFVLIAWPRKD
jgi:hypothetical protein